MPINVTFNGVTYPVPVTGDLNWGPPDTRYMVALGQFALAPSGGIFTLTADVNFGTSFGLLAPYYKSSNTPLATAGQLRLAKTDTIEWRNNANAADNILAVNGSDQLTFNGSTIGTGGGQVNSGTAGNFGYYAASTNVISDSGVNRLSPTFTGTASAATFQGTQITNQLSFTGGGGGNQIRTVNIAATSTVGEVITLPDTGGSDTFALLGGTQTFTGTKTFNSAIITLGGNLNANSNKITSLAAPTTTGDALSQGNAISGTTGAFSSTLTPSGQIQMNSGNASLSAPGYSFSGDTNTGWTHNGAGHMIWSAGGVELADWSNNTNGIVFFKGLDIQNQTLINGGTLNATGINFGGTTLTTYAEGTWTPADASGASLVITNTASAYTRIGRAVIINAFFTYPVTANGSAAVISGLPFMINGGNLYGTAFSVSLSTSNVGIRFQSGTTQMVFTSTAGGAQLTNAQMSGIQVIFSGTYFV